VASNDGKDQNNFLKISASVTINLATYSNDREQYLSSILGTV